MAEKIESDISRFTAAVYETLQTVKFKGLKHHEKLVALAFALSASAASAETWNCVCTAQDDFGACIAWQCSKGDYPGEPTTKSLRTSGTELEQLLKKVDDKEATELQISVSAK